MTSDRIPLDHPPHSTAPKGNTLVLAAVCLAGMMMPLSFTAPGIAIPAIAKTLGGSRWRWVGWSIPLSWRSAAR